MTQKQEASQKDGKSNGLTIFHLKGWTEDRRTIFLAKLVATSNVTASARAAQMSTQSAYKLRERDAAFDRDWGRALAAGYAELEMELLHRARFGVEKPVFYQGEEVGKIREYTDASSMRILLAHKAAVMALRAQENADDEPDIRETLSIKLTEMRERLAAKAKNSQTDTQS